MDVSYCTVRVLLVNKSPLLLSVHKQNTVPLMTLNVRNNRCRHTEHENSGSTCMASGGLDTSEAPSVSVLWAMCKKQFWRLRDLFSREFCQVQRTVIRKNQAGAC